MLSAFISLNGKCPLIVSLIADTNMTVSSSTSTTSLFGFPPDTSYPATTSIVFSTAVKFAYSSSRLSQTAQIIYSKHPAVPSQNAVRITPLTHCLALVSLASPVVQLEGSRFFHLQTVDWELALHTQFRITEMQRSHAVLHFPLKIAFFK